MSGVEQPPPHSELRQLRHSLEAAQGEVRRLTKALARARAPDDKRLADAERLATQLEQRRRELETSSREREREWQQRERALRDELDALRLELKASATLTERSERELKRLRKKSPASTIEGVLASLSKLLRSSRDEPALEQARAEIARLNRQLNVVALTGRGRWKR